jgi:hypothetical protein
MLKKGLGLVLLFLLCLPLFAEEEFTITTYYPSPYGSYNQLEVYRSVTYKPLNKDTITDPRQGEMVYNSSDDSIYVYNGSSWVAQGGGGAVISLKCQWSMWNSQYGSWGSNSCIPPTCPSNWSDVGTGCVFSGGFTFTGAPSSAGYGGYCERWCYKQ